MTPSLVDEGSEPGKGRLEALTDGVFAIAMTILVFGLHLRQFPPVVSGRELAAALLEQWPSLAAYALSFIVLGQFWLLMHNQFRFIRRADHWFIWLDIGFLFFISLVPFSADHLGLYGAKEPVVALYAMNLLALALLQGSLWAWATRSRHLVDPDLAESLIRQGYGVAVLAVAGYAVALIAAPFLPLVSIGMFVLVPFLNVTGLAYRLAAGLWG